MQPLTQRFKINSDPAGVREIAYLEWQSNSKQIVVCVHGLTRNAHDFDFLAPAMAPHARVIVPDIVGRGLSTWLIDSAQYNYGTYVTDMLALLDHLGIERCQWVGTSMGGIIGMTIAATQPEKISALVLNDIGSIVARQGLSRIANYTGKTKFESQTEAEAQLRSAYASFGLQNELQWQHLFAHTIKADGDGFILNYDARILDSYKAQTNNYTKIEDIDLTSVWEKITCPILVLRGENSDILRLDTLVQMKMNPLVESMEIKNVGHAPSLYQNHEISIIADWLATQG